MDEDKIFHFPEISVWLDESEYLEVADLIRSAANLFGDGAGGDLGENSEYERGIAEFICETSPIPMELKEEVIAAIHTTAKLKG